MKKKIFSGLLGLMILLIGFCFANLTGNFVLASDTTSSDVYCELMDISNYRDMTNGNTAPKPTDDEHLDWIFAGWFYDEACTQAVGVKATSGERYAKFVPADVLSVKCQVTADTDADSTTSDMRLVSTVESSKIYRAGFRITIINKEDGTSRNLNCTCETVYGKIKAESDGVAYKYSPNVFDLESTYFSTLTITGIPTDNFDDIFIVEPYWITKDNTTVYGIGRYARVSDSYNNIVNIPIRLYSDTYATAGDVQVTFEDEAFKYYGYDADNVLFTTTGEPTVTGDTVTCSVSGDSTKADGMLVNLRFQAVDGQTLKTLEPRYSFTVSGTNFKNADGTDTEAPNAPDISYRNLSASSTTAYTDWYDVSASETGKEYVIATAPELYGLGELSESYNFANDTIYIAGDIAVNQGTPTTREEWEVFDTSGLKQWTSIGSTTYPFEGKFYGQQHTISGVYYNSDLEMRGFFGSVIGAVIQDFELRDSYLGSSNVKLGSVIGSGSFTLSGVYSNAVVMSAHAGYTTSAVTSYVGGIAGYVSGVSTISNCMFEGTVVAESARSVGGMVGVAGADLKMNHCSYTGSLYSATAMTAPRVGGFCGYANDNVTLAMKDCLYSGNIIFKSATKNETTVTASSNQSGVIVGKYKTLEASNVYTTTYQVTKYEVTTDEESGEASIAINEEFNLGFTNASTGTLNGVSLIADLTGFNGLDASLDYTTDDGDEDYWALVKGDVPCLRRFATSGLLYTPDTSCYNEETDTYTIADAHDLYYLAMLSNKDSKTFGGATIEVVADITLNDGNASNWSEDTPMYDWIPIGSSSVRFKGSFDGQGYTISGLYLNTTENYQGLFGYVETSGVIGNFRLENSCFVSAGKVLGSIAGGGYATFRNVYSDARIVNTCNAASGRVAGVIGVATDGTTFIEQCWFDGTIVALAQEVGGMVGAVNNTVEITHCLNSGTILNSYSANAPRTGGICGIVIKNKRLTIVDTLNAGSLTLDNSTNQCGTVIGIVNGSVSATNLYATTKNIIQNGTELTLRYYQLAEGVTISDEGVTSVSGGDITGKLAKTNAADLDWAEYWAVVPGDIPTLQVFRADTTWYVEATGEVSDPYIIKDVADFYGLGLLSRTTDFVDKTIRLGANIVINKDTPSTLEDWETYIADNSLNEWIPIGSSALPFAGTLDGKDYTISGLYIDSTEDAQGLFGETGSAGTVKDFSLKNSYVETSGTGVGSIAGLGSGTFSGIYSDAIVVNTGTSTEGTGGIVGRVCTQTANVISNCEFAGLAQADYRGVGGIVGTVVAGNLTIEHCYSSGSLIKTSVGNNAARMGGICGSVLNDATTGGESDLIITDSLSVADMTSYVNNNQLGAVVGIVATGTEYEESTLNSDLNADAVYATVADVEEYIAYVGTGLSVWDYKNGSMDWTLTSNMSGYGALTYASRLSWVDPTAGTDNTGNYWIAISGELPTLAKFWDGTGSQLDPSDVITSDSADHGAGNLVSVQSEVTKATYDTYLEELESRGYTRVYENVIGGTVFTATYQNNAAEELYVTVTYRNSVYDAEAESYSVSNARMYIAYSSYVEFSPHLTSAQIYTAEDAYTIEDGTTTLHMLELVGDYGNSFVIQLENGHFIVNDGGTQDDLSGLIAYLEGLTEGGKKPVIEAWVISHSHTDHSGVLKNIETYSDKIYVEGIYYNSPSEDSFDKDTVDVRAYDAYVRKATAYLNTTDGSNPKLYRPMTGQQYFFGNVTMDVVLSQDQITVSSYANGYNETSTWVKYTLGDEDVLIGGDSGQAGMKDVYRSYTKEYLTVDVMAALHHGANTWDTFSGYCKVKKCVLFTHKYNPTSYVNCSSDSGWDKSVVDSNRKLVGLEVIEDLTLYEDLSQLDTEPTIPYKYLNGGTVTLAFGNSED